MDYIVFLVSCWVFGFLGGYFGRLWYQRRASKQAVSPASVSENTAKYQYGAPIVPHGTGYYRLTDEQVERIWVAVREGACECGCEEFTESERMKGRLQ